MHSQNYKKGNSGLLSEYNRTMYGKTDTTSKGLIDPTKTHLNYNICSHIQYKPREIVAIQEKIRGKKFAKNGNLFGTTIITLPKDYTGDTRKFFESAYKKLKKLYGLKEEDVVSAYVHMDETTPHLHFCFIPVKHLEDRDVVSWEKVMTKSMFNTQHSKLAKMMKDDLGVEVSLLNGETLGIDVTKMTKENKILSMENTQLKKELSQVKEELTTVEFYKSQLAEEASCLVKESQALEEKVKAKESLLERLEGLFVALQYKVETFFTTKEKHASLEATERQKGKPEQILHRVFGSARKAQKEAESAYSKLKALPFTGEAVESVESTFQSFEQKADRYREAVEEVEEELEGWEL